MTLFPHVLTLDHGVSVTLYADGTYTGDPAALERYLMGLLTDQRLPDCLIMPQAVVLWLLLRAMQDDRKIGRPPRSNPPARRQ